MCPAKDEYDYQVLTLTDKFYRTSQRSRKSKSGLDYSKIIIITNSDYIRENDAIVDKDEYNETVSNIELIKKGTVNWGFDGTTETYINYFFS